MRWVCALQVGELDIDEMKHVSIDGTDVLLYRFWDGIFATSVMCTHEDKPLTKGWIYRGCVVCPRHTGSFDIRTGKAVAAPCIHPIETYRVEVRGMEIWVQLNAQGDRAGFSEDRVD